MQILSENLYKYIVNNFDIEDEIKQEDIDKITDLNINSFNNKLQEARFIPEELSYFKNLQKCQFNSFLINDEIINNLEKLEKLDFLSLEHCEITGNKNIKNRIKKICLNYSDFNFINMLENKNSLEKLVLKDIVNVDVNKIYEFKNLKELELLNCSLLNARYITQLEKLESIKIIGCELDICSLLEKLRENVSVVFSRNKFMHVG